MRLRGPVSSGSEEPTDGEALRPPIVGLLALGRRAIGASVDMRSVDMGVALTLAKGALMDVGAEAAVAAAGKRASAPVVGNGALASLDAKAASVAERFDAAEEEYVAAAESIAGTEVKGAVAVDMISCAALGEAVAFAANLAAESAAESAMDLAARSTAGLLPVLTESDPPASPTASARKLPAVLLTGGMNV